ncbi:MAG: hypothetical protein KZQ95_12830 [Candidatus Thiodiazotropha sp. (ex Epidulcina cf. delphinae)]|nr:hypothetical protein [Candidatus Thiodiazotropha sp. (ex Epidulcina cf. delphinae)]
MSVRLSFAKDQPPVLERLQIDPKHWLYMTQHFESKFKGLVGAAYTLKAACQTLGYRRTPNLAACRRLLTYVNNVLKEPERVDQRRLSDARVRND